MRSLALHLQDMFVPRSAEACGFDSVLPPPLRSCFASAAAWRVRLKGQGDCTLPPEPPVPLLWDPLGRELGGLGGSATRSLLLRKFDVDVIPLEGDGEGGFAPRGGGGDGGQAGGAGVPPRRSRVVSSADVHALLDSLPSRLRGGATAGVAGSEGGQLVAALQPPVLTLWRQFTRENERVLAGGGSPLNLSRWLGHVDNPLVRALSGCGAGAGGDARAESLGAEGAKLREPTAGATAASTLATAAMLDDAKHVLAERVLVVVFGGNGTRTAQGLETLRVYFGWRRRRGEPPDDDDDDDSGNGSEQPPPAEAAAIRRRVVLDSHLFDFGTRLASEQHRSVVWAEDSDDACASAEAAGVAPMRDAPLALVLDRQDTLSWDGDTYRSYELR